MRLRRPQIEHLLWGYMGNDTLHPSVLLHRAAFVAFHFVLDLSVVDFAL